MNPGRETIVVGGPEKVRDELQALATGHAADELMLVTITHDHEDRVRSYELIAEAFDLPVQR